VPLELLEDDELELEELDELEEELLELELDEELLELLEEVVEDELELDELDGSGSVPPHAANRATELHNNAVFATVTSDQSFLLSDIEYSSLI
jgi:hypothetical protein